MDLSLAIVPLCECYDFTITLPLKLSFFNVAVAYGISWEIGQVWALPAIKINFKCGEHILFTGRLYKSTVTCLKWFHTGSWSYTFLSSCSAQRAGMYRRQTDGAYGCGRHAIVRRDAFRDFFRQAWLLNLLYVFRNSPCVTWLSYSATRRDTATFILTRSTSLSSKLRAMRSRLISAFNRVLFLFRWNISNERGNGVRYQREWSQSL